MKLTRVEQIINEEVRVAFDSGEKYFKQGNYQQSMDYYKKILEYDENSEIANNAKDEIQKAQDALNHLKKGEELMRAKNFAEAILQFDYVLALNRDDPRAQEQRREAMVILARESQRVKQEALAQLQQKNYAKAVALLNVVARTDRDDADARAKLKMIQEQVINRLAVNYEKGLALYNAGNFPAAVQAFSVVREINPNYKDVAKLFRRAAEQISQRQQRQVVVQRANNTAQVQTLFYQGIEFYRQNKLREAIGVWSRILAIDPGNARAQQYIQRAKFRLGG